MRSRARTTCASCRAGAWARRRGPATMPLTSLPHVTNPLRDPALNKGTAFTLEERDALGLRGLLPPRVCTLEEQIARVMENLGHKQSPLEKYIFLASLQ